MAFTGFPPAGRAFLAGLAANNEKAWFDAHRATYDACLLEPARALVVEVGAALAGDVPGLVADPRVNASIFKLNRDLRFSRDRRPYKDHLDLMWWIEGGRPRERPGFLFRLTATELHLGAGAIHRGALADPAGEAPLRALLPDGYALGTERGLHAIASGAVPAEAGDARLVALLVDRYRALAPFLERVRALIDA